MHAEPIQALQAASRPRPREAAGARLLIAGATGVLGNEVLRRLVGAGRYGATEVLAREPIRAGLRGVTARVVPGDAPAAWPPAQAGTAIVLFEPPRLYHDRERALWTPQPGQLPELAAWLHAAGATTLAVVLPHAQGRLPGALKRGLASLDEHAVAALGFERLLIIRSAEKPKDLRRPGILEALARLMLSVSKFMVPSSEQPVRAAKVAELVALALETAPPGIHVAAPELVWRASQGQARAIAAEWLGA